MFEPNAVNVTARDLAAIEDGVWETERAVEQHLLLLEAIRLRQGATAREYMRNIILSAANRLLWETLPEKYADLV